MRRLLFLVIVFSGIRFSGAKIVKGGRNGKSGNLFSDFDTAELAYILEHQYGRNLTYAMRKEHDLAKDS